MSTYMHGSSPHRIARDAADEAAQLFEDLRALQGIDGEGCAVEDGFSRPAVLRRLAHFAALHVPPGTDRLVAFGDLDVPLVTAISLLTGVPFAVVHADRSIFGELHGSEVVVCVGASRQRIERVVNYAREARTTLAGCVFVNLNADGSEGLTEWIDAKESA